EDGIRDFHVTGVQTCALPICTFKGDISSSEDSITVNGRTIRISAEKDPEQLPWGKLGVDVVLECTGRFTAREGAQKHLNAGAKKVLISAPGKNSDYTMCYGINSDAHDPKAHAIISNASCTTKARKSVV